MTNLTNDCKEFAHSTFSRLDVVRLCNVLLFHYRNNTAKTRDSAEVQEKLRAWNELLPKLPPVVVHYIETKGWVWGGIEADEIDKRFPGLRVTPEAALEKDRELAEECLKEIALLEKESYRLRPKLAEELIETLGWVVLPKRREMFPILRRIPTEKLDKDFESDDSDDSDHEMLNEDTSEPVDEHTTADEGGRGETTAERGSHSTAGVPSSPPEPFTDAARVSPSPEASQRDPGDDVASFYTEEENVGELEDTRAALVLLPRSDDELENVASEGASITETCPGSGALGEGAHADGGGALVERAENRDNVDVVWHPQGSPNTTRDIEEEHPQGSPIRSGVGGERGQDAHSPSDLMQVAEGQEDEMRSIL
jgi:hypothetical protein